MTQVTPRAEFDGYLGALVYPHCAAVSAAVRRFLAIPASSATSGRLFWRLVGCRLASFTSAAPSPQYMDSLVFLNGIM